MTRCSIVLAAGVLLSLFALRAAVVGAQAGNEIVEFDPAFQRIVPDGARVEKLAEGFRFIEGPLWDPAGFLLFSDITANQILKWTPDGHVTTFRQPSGKSNGLTFDRQGRLIACEGGLQGNRRVSRTEKNGIVVTLAERYQGRRLNSPNDVVVRSDGSIYFTDPPFEINDGEQEQPFQGVFRISPEGELTLLADDFLRPNGLAFSPDEKTLYVDDTPLRHIRAFDVGTDGTLAKGRVFATLRSSGNWTADGMKVDIEGNIYCTGPGAVEVFDPSAKRLGMIKPPQAAANLGWGDADGKGLYMTAQHGLYRIRLNVPGIRP